MDQLKVAQHNLELGKYQVAVNAYKSALIALKQQIKDETDSERRNQLVEVSGFAEKELELLRTLMDDMKKINLTPTPETPTDPMVWPAAPPKCSPVRPGTRSTKPPVPFLKKVTATTRSAPRRGFASSSSTKNVITQKSTSMRRTNSQPKLHQSYGSVDEKVENSEAENEDGEKKFDSSSYEKELVDMIERSVIQKNPGVKWSDIAGHKDTKRTLTEAALLPHYFPDFFTGIRRPWKGICLFGPPGTGKTMLAKAVATECNSTFFSVSSSNFASKYRGDSEKLARFHAPSTIFIDELDVICSKRGGESEHEASRRMKGELLVQIDGMSSDSEKPVLLLAATNCPWDLDEAFRRRLEKRIFVGLPDQSTRLDLLKLSLCSVKLAEDVCLTELAQHTEGYSGADITNLCRDAALQPMREALDDLGDYRMAMEKMTSSQLQEKPIRMNHFRAAMSKVSPSCNKDDVKKYVTWQQTYGAT